MKKLLKCSALLCAAALAGCTGDATTTDDSTHLELDVPKVEVGEDDIDLDPRTDGDVDIDTPEAGDS